MDKSADHSETTISTISEAVAVFINALSKERSDGAVSAIKDVSIERFVEGKNLPAFIHLICNATLLNQARFPTVDFEKFLEKELESLKETHWFIPAALALVELRYSNNTLTNLTDAEKDAIRLQYGLDRLRDRNHLQYYKSGTTSIIFISSDSAVKIVRPVYLMDREVASLDRYMDQYAGAPLSPKVFWSESDVLVMEWIRGDTLEEVIQKSAEEASFEDRLSFVRALGAMIGEIHGQGFPHGDLNPRNIIVEVMPGAEKKLRLIDYGFNYSLTKPVLSAQSYRESVRYIAPAINDANRDAYQDDIYSLAVIILDVWFGDVTRPAEELLHEMSIIQPLLAFVLEDALVNDPALMLRKISRDEKDNAKRAKKFSEAIQLACSDRAQSTRASQERTSLLSVARASPLEFFTADVSIDGESLVLDAETNRRLNFFRGLCISTMAISASLIISIGANSYLNTDSVFSNLRSAWSEAGYGVTQSDAGFWDILPGLAVCMSFLFLATKYYLAIFSSTAPQRDIGFGGFEADMTMRINSFAFALPIAYCFLLDPKMWPFCSAIGLAIVAINNVYTFRMLRKVRRSSSFRKLALSRSADAKTSYVVFAGWGALVSWYALGIVLAGLVLLTSEGATNRVLDRFVNFSQTYNIYEYLLALCVIGINYFKMQRENCGRLAPKMRALIQRYIEASKVLR